MNILYRGSFLELAITASLHSIYQSLPFGIRDVSNGETSRPRFDAAYLFQFKIVVLDELVQADEWIASAVCFAVSVA
jgi:hypothetical protein